jgi:hypothetical protein
MTLESLTDDEYELIRAACTPRGHFFHPIHQEGFRYAFVWELPEDLFQARPGWDPAGELYAALAFSRLIVDNGGTTLYAARYVEHHDGSTQVIPAGATEAAVAFMANPAQRDWMDATEAAELAELLSKTLAGSTRRVLLPPRVLRANWLQEYAVRWRYADLVLTLLVTAIEALINTGKDVPTKQFTTRVPQLAAELGLSASRTWCSKIYSARSHGVHGRFVNLLTYQPEGRSGSGVGVDDLARLQNIVRRTIRTAIAEDTFRQTFNDDGSVRQWSPVLDADGTPV